MRRPPIPINPHLAALDASKPATSMPDFGGLAVDLARAWSAPGVTTRTRQQLVRAPTLPRRQEEAMGRGVWSDFASTVGRQGNERTIGAYVKQQGSDYQQLHQDHQLALF